MSNDSHESEHGHRLTKDQKDTLDHLVSLYDADELKSLDSLIEHEPHITTFFGKRKAYALVFGGLQKVVTWFAAFSGALWLGFDKISAMFRWVINLILNTT